MNHPQTSFARSLPPRAVAIGRTIQLPPLGRPATLNHAQMYDDRRAGQLVWVCDRHAPVRVNLFRGQGFSPERLGRRHIAGGPFKAGGRDCNRALAEFINSQAFGAVQGYSDLPEVIHSKISVPSAHEHEAEGVGSDQKAIGVSQNVDDC